MVETRHAKDAVLPAGAAAPGGRCLGQERPAVVSDATSLISGTPRSRCHGLVGGFAVLVTAQFHLTEAVLLFLVWILFCRPVSYGVSGFVVLIHSCSLRNYQKFFSHSVSGYSTHFYPLHPANRSRSSSTSSSGSSSSTGSSSGSSSSSASSRSGSSSTSRSSSSSSSSGSPSPSRRRHDNRRRSRSK